MIYKKKEMLKEGLLVQWEWKVQKEKKDDDDEGINGY